MMFPLFKLGGLFAKTLMKPVSNQLKSYAASSPRFSHTCLLIAKGYFTTYNGMAKTLRLPYKVSPLTNKQAVKLGTELLGEGLVFGCATGVLAYEYSKSSQISKTRGHCNNLMDVNEKLKKNQERVEKFTIALQSLEKENQQRIKNLEQVILEMQKERITSKNLD